jgi:hypothetical protein
MLESNLVRKVYSAVLLAALLWPLSSRAQEYELIDLYAKYQIRTVYAINNRGWMTGSYGDDYRGYALIDGVMHDLGDPLPGFPTVQGVDINESGQVALRMTSIDGTRDFFWQNGMRTEIAVDVVRGFSIGINESGSIVGSTSQGPGYVWRDGTVALLPRYSGSYENALAINSAGVITGTAETQTGWRHAVYWDKHGIHDIHPFNGNDSEARDINDAGQMGGTYTTSMGQQRPVIWTNGVPQDMGVFSNGVRGEIFAINNLGWAVGWSNANLADRAALWREGQVINLNTAVAGSGWNLGYAPNDINDDGWIVGFSSRNGGLQGYVLVPVAEASTGAGLSFLAVAMIFRRKSKLRGANIV